VERAISEEEEAMRRILGICLLLLCLASAAPAVASTEISLTLRLTELAQHWLQGLIVAQDPCEECQGPPVEVGGGMDPNG
jgi:hypothetical protein